MEQKNQEDKDMNNSIPKNTMKTASKEEVKAFYDKAVKRYGKVLEWLSKS